MQPRVAMHVAGYPALKESTHTKVRTTHVHKNSTTISVAAHRMPPPHAAHAAHAAHARGGRAARHGPNARLQFGSPRFPGPAPRLAVDLGERLVPRPLRHR